MWIRAPEQVPADPLADERPLHLVVRILRVTGPDTLGQEVSETSRVSSRPTFSRSDGAMRRYTSSWILAASSLVSRGTAILVASYHPRLRRPVAQLLPGAGGGAEDRWQVRAGAVVVGGFDSRPQRATDERPATPATAHRARHLGQPRGRQFCAARSERLQPGCPLTLFDARSPARTDRSRIRSLPPARRSIPARPARPSPGTPVRGRTPVATGRRSPSTTR